MEKAGASLQAASRSSNSSSDDNSVASPPVTTSTLSSSSNVPTTRVSAGVTSMPFGVSCMKTEVRKSSSLSNVDVSCYCECCSYWK